MATPAEPESGLLQPADAGRSYALATMTASGKLGWERLYHPMPASSDKARFKDIESVRRALAPDSVVVMIERMRGEAGVNLADRHFVRELRTLCSEGQMLLIVDEVQTGIGRCGCRFAHERDGLRLDTMTPAKGLGGGVSLAALPCTERLHCFESGDQGGTYCANPLVTVTGLAVPNKVSHDAVLAQVRVGTQQ